MLRVFFFALIGLKKLTCYSEDTGMSQVEYYLFKLMPEKKCGFFLYYIIL